MGPRCKAMLKGRASVIVRQPPLEEASQGRSTWPWFSRPYKAVPWWWSLMANEVS